MKRKDTSRFSIGDVVRVDFWVPGAFPIGTEGRVLTVMRTSSRVYRYRVSSENATCVYGCAAWYDEDALSIVV